MSKPADALRAKLAALLHQQAEPTATPDADATATRLALLKALARATAPTARSKTFKPAPRQRRRPTFAQE